MATAVAHPLARLVRQFAGSPFAALSDADLLERYTVGSDEAAFAALVRRHGPMVLAACHRILGDHHAAEDAFQATFLVLARKATTLRQPELLGNWLYGVACRTARKARGRQTRRTACERRAAASEACPAEEPIWRDLRPVLDEALTRLPDKYRAAVVLCYLEGRTVAEAAGQLGWPRGTVATRLAWARQQLRRQLSRRGLSLSATALAAALSERAATACVPPALLTSTTRSGARLPRGGPIMLLTKGKVVALVLALAVAGGGAALPGQRTQDIPPKEAKTPETPARVSGAGDRLLFLEGSTRFLLGDYPAAGRAFSRLAEDRGSSPFAARAIELAILSKHLASGAEAERERKVAEGRRIIEQALANGAARPDGSAHLVFPSSEEQAEKDFKLGEFYRRTGHPGTAQFYYELVQRRYPKSKFAAQAAEELLYARLKKNGQLSHPGFDYSMFVRGVQGRRLLGPVLRHRNSRGKTDSTATAEEAELRVDMKNQKLLVRMRRGMAWSETATTKATVWFNERNWTIDLPPSLLTTPEPEKPAKAAARIGQIFIVGNTKTEQGIILDACRLFPGAALKYPDLQQAERNLRKLGIFEDDPAKSIHPTVSVMDPNGESPYKDILIQVQEKK